MADLQSVTYGGTTYTIPAGGGEDEILFINVNASDFVQTQDPNVQTMTLSSPYTVADLQANARLEKPKTLFLRIKEMSGRNAEYSDIPLFSMGETGFYGGQQFLYDMGTIGVYFFEIELSGADTVLTRTLYTTPEYATAQVAEIEHADHTKTLGGVVEDGSNSIRLYINKDTEGNFDDTLNVQLGTQVIEVPLTYDDTALAARVTANETALANRYTKTETDAKIAEAMTDVDVEHFHVVTVLPAVADAEENHEYVLVTYEQDGVTIATETHYLFYDGAYHQRTTAVSLDGYATEAYVLNAITDKTEMSYNSSDDALQIQDNAQSLVLRNTQDSLEVIMASPSVYHSDAELAKKDYVDTELATKQDALVSGTSIKTVNGVSVLGSGNIEILPEGALVLDVNQQWYNDELYAVYEAFGTQMMFVRDTVNNIFAQVLKVESMETTIGFHAFDISNQYRWQFSNNDMGWAIHAETIYVGFNASHKNYPPDTNNTFNAYRPDHNGILAWRHGLGDLRIYNESDTTKIPVYNMVQKATVLMGTQRMYLFEFLLRTGALPNNNMRTVDLSTLLADYTIESFLAVDGITSNGNFINNGRTDSGNNVLVVQQASKNNKNITIRTYTDMSGGTALLKIQFIGTHTSFS